jgi:hypothetical protein
VSITTKLFSRHRDTEPVDVPADVDGDELPTGAVDVDQSEEAGDVDAPDSATPTGAVGSPSTDAAASATADSRAGSRRARKVQEESAAARAAASPLARETPSKRSRKKRAIPHQGGKQKTEKESAPKRPMRPTSTGWLGRGGGQVVSIQPADEFRATTVQVCGLYPFSVGTGTPMIGVPLGKNLTTGASVLCDPISWFQRAQLISNPSMFVLGKPGLGKSSLTRRMATGLAGYGTIPLVLGDLKPDYVDLIRAMEGQVITLGRDRGYLNILDPGEATSAAKRLRDDADQALEQAAELDARGGDSKELHLRAVKAQRLAAQVLADAHGRRHTMIAALLTILRSQPPTDREETIIDRALKYLDEHHEGIPVLADLLAVIQAAPDEIRQVALDRNDLKRYKEITENLEASLIGLTSGGRLGEIFSRQTTTPMRRDRPVVYDVSSIDDSEGDLQAAILLACWSAGFGTVNVAAALADAGIEPRRHYFVILDELWRALRAGKGMVDRVDALTRLNRARGVGLAMISHTMSDLLALSSEEDRMKARGFVERSGMVICGGLPGAEMPLLTSAVPLSAKEQEMLTSWQDPPAWDGVSGKEADPPGRGLFLIKVGGRPGIPVRVHLTAAEKDVNDTNKLWHTTSRAGRANEPLATDPVMVEILP